ncbi:hypothetical protein AAHC03_024282 [Spirometra sp. Aus1]
MAADRVGKGRHHRALGSANQKRTANVKAYAASAVACQHQQITYFGYATVHASILQIDGFGSLHATT